jgi:hypothetical protein
MLRRAWWHGFSAVRSDDGYSVWFRGLGKGVEYSEASRVLRIPIEGARTKEANWIIYMGHLRRWLPPHHNEELSEEKRTQIRQRVVSALEFLKIKFHVED